MKIFEIIPDQNYTMVSTIAELADKGVDVHKMINGGSPEDSARLQNILLQSSTKIEKLMHGDKQPTFCLSTTLDNKVFAALGFRKELTKENLCEEREKLEKIEDKTKNNLDYLLVDIHLMFIESLFNTNYFDNPETKDMFDDVDDDLFEDADEPKKTDIYQTKDPKLNKIMFLINNMKEFGLIGKKAELYKTGQIFYVDVAKMSEADKEKTKMLLGEADFSRSMTKPGYIHEHCQRWAAL